MITGQQRAACAESSPHSQATQIRFLEAITARSLAPRRPLQLEQRNILSPYLYERKDLGESFLLFHPPICNEALPPSQMTGRVSESVPCSATEGPGWHGARGSLPCTSFVHTLHFQGYLPNNRPLRLTHGREEEAGLSPGTFNYFMPRRQVLTRSGRLSSS